MEIAIFFMLNLIIAGTTVLNLLTYISDEDEIKEDQAENMEGLMFIRIISLIAFAAIIYLQYSTIKEYVLISIPVIAVSIIANIAIKISKSK